MEKKANNLLYIGFMLHIEPIEEYTSPTGHKRASEKLRKLAEVFERHNAKMSIQSEKEFAKGCTQYDNVLLEMEQRGHQVSTHSMIPLTLLDKEEEKKRSYVRERKEIIDDLGIKNNIEVCGGWFLKNCWKDLADIGFRIASGYSEHGLRKFLKQQGKKWGSRLEEPDTCINPWRPSEAGWTSNWTFHNPKGRIVYVPGGYPLDLSVHPIGLEHHPITVESFRKITDSLERSLSVVDGVRVNSWYFASHIVDFDKNNWENEIKLYDKWMAEVVDPLMEKKKVQWKTIIEIGKDFMEWEKEHPDTYPKGKKVLL